MINKLLVYILLHVILSSVSRADDAKVAISAKSLLHTWEGKVESYYKGRGVRLPSVTHQFKGEVIFFKETQNLLNSSKNRDALLRLIANRIENPPHNIVESTPFYGFLYCSLSGVDHKVLLDSARSTELDLNAVVLHILIKKKQFSQVRENFSSFPPPTNNPKK